MSFCFICHRNLGDSYDLMWAGKQTRKLVPVCTEDRECRAIGAQRKRTVPKDGPKARKDIGSAIVAQKEVNDNGS